MPAGLCSTLGRMVRIGARAIGRLMLMLDLSKVARWSSDTIIVMNGQQNLLFNKTDRRR